MEKFYWIECSDAAEKFFKKDNVFPIPNNMVSQLLGLPSESIRLLDDGVYYERVIGTDGMWFEKIILAFKDEETYHKVIQIIDDYEGFIKMVNNQLSESNGNSYTLKQALFIIDNIYRCNEEDGFNELIPSWYEAMLKAIETLKSIENKERYINRYIEIAEYLLEIMPMVTINKFNI